MKTVFKNARVLAEHIDPGYPTGTCLVVEDSHISYIGNESDDVITLLLDDEENDRVDLKGQTVIPSFIDAHVHLLQFGISLAKVDLRPCKSLAEIEDVIHRTAEARPDAARLLFQGWRHAVTGSNVSASTLDRVSARPIFLDSDDLHSAWCNTAALDEMDIRNKADPEGGKIHRDHQGAPTGFLEEAAVLSIVWPFLSEAMSRGEKLSCLRSAIREYNKAGYTAVVDMAMDETYWGLLLELKNAGELTLRVAAHFLVMPGKTDEENLAQVERVVRLHEKYNLATSPDLRVAGIKIVCDGVVDGCTAAISHPYLNTGELVDPTWTPAALQVVLGAADAANMQCALHAIGDAAVSMAVNGLEVLGTTGRRHRIEHLELTRPEDAQRLGRLGITASIQPVHLDPEYNQLWPPLIGHESCARAFAYREFHDFGAHLAIGSDAPTAPHSPWNNIFNATTRRSFRRPQDAETFNEQYKLDLNDVFSAASHGGAYSCFAENMIGGLRVGKKADFIILEGDTKWSLDLSSLLASQVSETWLGGRRVFNGNEKL
ncbi:Putative metal-dependent hydrolase, composite domain superfamily, amidohydrolase 3 [Colletotrichum destructivum]|uniref:Metal-dependent hydrolase, composite domain superfamily, amidohydrolase 3 n=1 Tax=Colletotrichum destructivum TaxID=34406 RepID=A0AAX4IJS2_9PEZI|nr:Putative metal-dependent hydrolase, composite domain superfamily, amidohydrolase 3 [Colletotrichum destructivum]